MLFKYFCCFCFFWVVSFATFAQNVPQRIVSLAPSLTEIVYLLDEADKLVGCTGYCTHAINDGVEEIGSTVDVNVEKIVSLQPDLVITMLMTKQQDLETLKKLGIKVEVIPTPVSFDEICEQTHQIAEIIGCTENAQQIIEKIKGQVDSLKQLSKRSFKKQKFFFQIGANPVFTVLENTFMNDFITFCNGENIAGGMKRGTITRESVLLKNPDVIIIATMGGFGESELNTWKNFDGLNAVKNNKIFLVPSETSCSPTPDNFLKAFSDILNQLNR